MRRTTQGSSMADEMTARSMGVAGLLAYHALFNPMLGPVGRAVTGASAACWWTAATGWAAASTWMAR